MKFQPLHDRVLVQRVEADDKRGSIIIPENAKEKPQRGVVIAVGTGRIEKDGTRPLDVKVDDVILFGKYAGQEIAIEGTDYLIVREEEILGVLEG